MNNYNYILNLLEFQDDCLEIDKILASNPIEIYTNFLIKQNNVSCPRCGSIHYNIHSYYSRKVNHICISKTPSIIIIKMPRFICMDCKKTYNPKMSIVSKNRRMSNELLNSLKSEYSKKKSFKDIAKENCLSETTISNEFRKQIFEYRCPLSEVICLDEFRSSTREGTFALIIGDPISGTILDILPSRKQDYIAYYLQTLKNDEISKVKYIVTDLNIAYRTIIQSYFPKAVHIADRFHVTQLVAKAFNTLRIRTMNNYIKLSKDKNNPLKYENYKYAKELKNNYKLLLSNRAKNGEIFYNEFTKKDRHGFQITRNQVIESLVNADLDLEEAYTFLQSFYRLFRYSNIDNIKTNLDKWCNDILESKYHIEELRKITITIKYWQKEIINSFIINPITKERLTNGFIEGKNNFVKTIKRIGFGYKDFDVFRNRILNINRNN